MPFESIGTKGKIFRERDSPSKSRVYFLTSATPRLRFLATLDILHNIRPDIKRITDARRPRAW